MLPELRWSMLPVLSQMDPSTILNEVLYCINAPASDRLMVTHLEELAHRIFIKTMELGFFRPSFITIAEELCFLRFFRHMDRNMPIFPHGDNRLAAYLGIRPRGCPYTRVSPLYDMFEEIRDALLQLNSREIERITLDIGSESKSSFSLKGKANAVTAHMLTAVMGSQIAPEVLGIITPPEKRRLTKEKVLAEFRKFTECLEPAIEVYHYRLNCFRNFFSPGNAVIHSQFGLGIVLENNNDEIQVRFSGGEARSFMLLDSLLDGQLFIDSLEFRRKLVFSRAELKHGANMVQLLEDVNSRIQELESGEVSKERLIELLPPWKDL